MRVLLGVGRDRKGCDEACLKDICRDGRGYMGSTLYGLPLGMRIWAHVATRMCIDYVVTLRASYVSTQRMDY